MEDEDKETSKVENLEESGLICSQDVKIGEVKAKLPGFNSVFRFGENLHFITNKGVQTWQYKKNDETHLLKPQIIINQVEMLQFPIDKFSFTHL